MRTFILFIVVHFSTPAFSQLDSVFFFNEFSLSANHTNLANDNTENRTGDHKEILVRLKAQFSSV